MNTNCYVFEVQDEKGFIAKIRNGQSPPVLNTKLTQFEGETPPVHSAIALIHGSTSKVDYYRVLYHLFCLTEREFGSAGLQVVLVYVVRIQN